MANQVDPVLLARRLADIPNVSNAILTPNAVNNSSRLNSIESPPYGAGTLLQLPLALSGLLRSGLNSSGSLTPQSYGHSHMATPTLRQPASNSNNPSGRQGVENNVAGSDLKSIDS